MEGQPCYSIRLIEPFLRALRKEGRLPEMSDDWLQALGPDARLPAASVHLWLRGDGLHDEDIGLKASREMELGDAGALDYALSSAATLGDALHTAGRYIRLVNDDLDSSIDVEGERAIVRLNNKLVLPRPALDFQICAFLRNQSRVWPDGMMDEIQVYFPYPEPLQRGEHERTLGPASFCFDAPFAGFSFPSRYLSEPIKSADSNLHQVMRNHAELVLATLPRVRSLTEQIRELLVQELTSGSITAERIARRLHMSKRTLGRRLEQEGTTFFEVLDSLRKELALRYLQHTELSIEEVALVTGFSNGVAFHRAFRRWTSDSPSSYRNRQRARGLMAAPARGARHG